MDKAATVRKVPETTPSYPGRSEGVANTEASRSFEGLKMGGKQDKIWALPKATQRGGAGERPH